MLLSEMKMPLDMKMKPILRSTAVLLVELAVILSCLAGCSDSREPSVDMDQLRSAMTEACGNAQYLETVGSFSEEAENSFSYLCDFDYSRVREYYFCYSGSGDADEATGVLLKDSGDAAELKRSLERHISQRERLFEQYAPEKAHYFDSAVIKVSGSIVFMAVGDDARAMANACLSVLNDSGSQGR